MESADLLSLLGLPSTDPQVEGALQSYMVRNRPHIEIDPDDPDGPVVATEDWVKNSRQGIEFGFQDEAVWLGLDKTEYGKRPLLLTQLYLYGQHEGMRPYSGSLPFGLRLEDDREKVRERMRPLAATRHSHIRDTWDAPNFRITVSYVDGGSAVRFVFCTLREPPLPALPYALAPVPSPATLIGLLDRSLHDPEVERALGPLGLHDRWAQVEEAAEADFRNPYGLLVEFLDVPAQPPGIPAERVVSTITLLQEREFDGRAWPGLLPHAIVFDDSLEMVVAKVGRPPDRASDGDTSGFAEWHHESHTLHVVYDSMSNRTLRVALVAPGLGTTWDDEAEDSA